MLRNYFAFSLVCLAILSSGCSSLGKMPTMPWESGQPETKIPSKMVVTWKDAVRYNPNDPPTRGFGARIHFYDESNQPIRVNGSLTIYGYDDARSKSFDAERPDRKFVFDADKLEGHYSLSKIGHSYSFWVPWDRAGGQQIEVTLAPFFRTESGQVIMSEQSKQILPGRENPAMPSMQPSPSDMMLPNEVAQVGYQRTTPVPQESVGQPAYTNPEFDQRPRTTTFSLPSTMQERLKNVVPNTKYDHTSRPTPSTAPAIQAMHHRETQPLPSGYAERFQNHAPRDFRLTPGVNLQTFRPQFSEAEAYSAYLAKGEPINRPQVMAPGAPPYSPQMTPQLPLPQTDQAVSNRLPTPQSPSTWPPGLQPTR